MDRPNRYAEIILPVADSAVWRKYSRAEVKE